MSETFGAALARATAHLRAAGVPDPARDARALLAHAAGAARGTLTARPDDPLPAGAAHAQTRALAARARRQPVAQITGRRMFWGRDFRVTPDTLDPRPETEALIAAALAGPVPARLLDLGTGTGILAVTLLAERPAAVGLATDISDAALQVAAANARAHGVAPRLALRRADWWRGLAGDFDLIVCNPPYISEDEYELLSEDVRGWEPRGALTPGGDGLAAYRRLAGGLARHLLPGGRALVEVGAGQADAVAGIFGAAGGDVVAVHPDMDGRARVVEVRNRG